MKKISKEKLLIILGVSLILVSLGLLGLTYPSRSKAATTSFSETWVASKYAHIQLAVHPVSATTSKIAYAVPTTHNGDASVKGVLGPGAWKISGCMNNASGSCTSSPDYEITYTVNGWYVEGSWTAANQSGPSSNGAGGLTSSDVSLDNTVVNICGTSSTTYINVPVGACSITSTAGQYNRHLSNNVPNTHYTNITLDATAWPTGWGITGTMNN
ncbi:MAG: hypothetical protein WCV58_02780 [Patescibacteria group bacterium]|jgi:hypothetical protein